MSGRTIVVTGGGTHLGRATAERFAAAGDTVVIASRNLDRCETTAAGIRARGGQCFAAFCNVTEPDSVRSLFADTEDRYGPVEVLVCNAGGSTTVGQPTLSAAWPDVEYTVRLNLLGTYASAVEAATRMASRGRGALVLVASIHGFLGSRPAMYEGLDFQPSGAAYHAAKGGVIQLARSLASGLGSAGIRVNCVSPGYIARPGSQGGALGERYSAGSPLRRLATAIDVANAIHFLAGDEAASITGQNLVVDAGWSIW